MKWVRILNLHGNGHQNYTEWLWCRAGRRSGIFGFSARVSVRLSTRECLLSPNSFVKKMAFHTEKSMLNSNEMFFSLFKMFLDI